nr:hypothetical protein [Pedobacter sp. ASV19]
MKNYIRSIILIAILSFCQSLSFGQRKDLSPSIPSPTAASLGVYGEMPVSYFTGIPSISLPLYEIKGNKLNLPITLNYYASGLRPEVHPSWVGNGWSLSAGGVITRKPNGMFDEHNTPAVGKLGYYFNYGNLNNSNWANNAGLNQAKVYLRQDQGNQIYDIDAEPDEFDFNFLGFSGKFFLDQTGNWQVQSDKKLKVVFCLLYTSDAARRT